MTQSPNYISDYAALQSWHGPECPAAVWQSFEVQSLRKAIFLAEENWSVFFEGRNNQRNPDAAIYLLIRQDGEIADPHLGVTAVRVFDRTQGVLPEQRAGSIMYSGMWGRVAQGITIPELIAPDDVFIRAPHDSYS